MQTLILVASLRAAELSFDLGPLVATGDPALVSGASVGLCEGTRQPLAAATKHVEAAERSITILDFAAARRSLDEARAALQCASEPITGNLAARVPFLEGIVAHLSGSGDAIASFQASLVLRPMQPWDPDFPPEAMLVFDRARAGLESAGSAVVSVVPSPVGGNLWVDGRSWTGDGGRIELTRGVHYLQLADRGWETITVTVASDDTLTVPAWVGADLDGWVEDPARGRVLARLLTRRLPAGTAATLRTADAAWTGEVGGDGWTRLPPPELPRRSPLPRAGLVVSALTLSAGVALLTGGEIVVTNAVADAEATDQFVPYRIARGSWNAGANLMRAGTWVAVAGGAGVAVSVPLVVLQDRRHRHALEEAVR